MYPQSTDTADKQAGTLGETAWSDTFPQGCDELDLLLQASWEVQCVLMPPTMPCRGRESVKSASSRNASDGDAKPKEDVSSAIARSLVEGFKSFSGAPRPEIAIARAITVTILWMKPEMSYVQLL